MAVFIPPRITTAVRSQLILSAGELVYDTTDGNYYRGDGETLGGVSENKRISEITTATDFNSLTSPGCYWIPGTNMAHNPIVYDNVHSVYGVLNVYSDPTSAEACTQVFTQSPNGWAFTRSWAIDTGWSLWCANYTYPGTIIPFAGLDFPTGFLPCDGAAISRTDYASLFSIIGTMYGPGDGSTTFNVPNLMDKLIYGSSYSTTPQLSDREVKGSLSSSASVIGLKLNYCIKY